MSKPIHFSLDGQQIELRSEVFTLLCGRERKITAAEQAVLLRMVHPDGIASGVPANPSTSVVAYLKHYKLLDRETEQPTAGGEYVAGMILDRSMLAAASAGA